MVREYRERRVIVQCQRNVHKYTQGVGRSKCLYKFQKDGTSHLVLVVDIDSRFLQ